MYITQLLVTGQLSFPEVTEGMGRSSVVNRTGITDGSSSSPSTHTWRLTPACISSPRGSDDQWIICPLWQPHSSANSTPRNHTHIVNVKQISSKSDGTGWRVGLLKNGSGPKSGLRMLGGSLLPATPGPEGSILSSFRWRWHACAYIYPHRHQTQELNKR